MNWLRVICRPLELFCSDQSKKKKNFVLASIELKDWQAETFWVLFRKCFINYHCLSKMKVLSGSCSARLRINLPFETSIKKKNGEHSFNIFRWVHLMIDVSIAGSGKKLELIWLITFEDSNAASQHCHQNNYTNKGKQTFFLLSISFAPQSGVKGYRRCNRRLFCRYFNVSEKN